MCALKKGIFMNEFFQTLTDPNIGFLRYAIIAGILSSISFGFIGSFVVVKRISYIAGAMSHCVLGGIGASLFLQSKFNMVWCTPMIGALCAALVAAFIIGFLSIYSKEREDSLIGALWVIGMATGILFIAKTPGYIDPMSYLFGNILMITKNDLWIVIVLDSFIVVSIMLFYNKLLALSFDEEFAALRGVRTKFLYIFLLCMVALTIVLLIRIVGIIMVIALITLPSATSSKFCNKLWHMMIVSTILCMGFVTGGIAVSFTTDLPTGPTIVVFSGGAYLLGLLLRFLKKYLIKN